MICSHHRRWLANNQQLQSTVDVEFDPAKDDANIAKDGLSLAIAELIEIHAVIRYARADCGEGRFAVFGTIEEIAYCLTFTLRSGTVRAISLRRARTKEYRRYVDQTPATARR